MKNEKQNWMIYNGAEISMYIFNGTKKEAKKHLEELIEYDYNRNDWTYKLAK